MKKITTALVVANKGKPIALQVKKEAQRFLRSRGIRLSASRPQLVITVGGDGTVLYWKKYYGVPFFPIGSQTSFICPANFSDWKKKLAAALAKPTLERRLLLQASLGGRPLPLSLNEVGIRNPEPRLLSIHLRIGKRHAAFRADGVLFSTPTGSPAYCYSCGGREMQASSSDYQVVAIAPFRRLFSPTTVPASTACTLRISGAGRCPVFIDGQPAGFFSEGQVISIQGSRKPFSFLKAKK